MSPITGGSLAGLAAFFEARSLNTAGPILRIAQHLAMTLMNINQLIEAEMLSTRLSCERTSAVGHFGSSLVLFSSSPENLICTCE